MKTKITLSALVLAGFYNGATAQTPGYTKTAIYDDFNTTEEYTDQNPADPNFPDGIYWWAKRPLELIQITQMTLIILLIVI